MTAPTLRRQDTGLVLILDGVVSERQINGRRVTEHEVETRDVIADHVQELARDYSLTWILSPYPTISGIQAGQARIEEVFSFLDQSRGVLVTLTRPGLPNERDLLIRAYPWERRDSDSFVVSLELRRARIAETTTIEGGIVRAGRSNRDDVAASMSGTKDKGDRSTKSANKSLLRAAVDLVTGGS